MATIKKKRTENKKCWKGCGENGTRVHHWWGYKMDGAATMGNFKTEALQTL